MPADLVPEPQASPIAQTAPAILRRAGQNALFAADEFFRATCLTVLTKTSCAARPLRSTGITPLHRY